MAEPCYQPSTHIGQCKWNFAIRGAQTLVALRNAVQQRVVVRNAEKSGTSFEMGEDAGRMFVNFLPKISPP